LFLRILMNLYVYMIQQVSEKTFPSGYLFICSNLGLLVVRLVVSPVR
jgi:hypothetical protein